jgi:hypothetical protein
MDKLKNIHCESFCKFNVGQNIDECKSKCLCPTGSIDDLNSLQGVKCVEKAIPEGNMMMHHHASVPKTVKKNESAAPKPIETTAPKPSSQDK